MFDWMDNDRDLNLINMVFFILFEPKHDNPPDNPPPPHKSGTPYILLRISKVLVEGF